MAIAQGKRGMTGRGEGRSKARRARAKAVQAKAREVLMNLPNQLTLVRLGLSLVLFALIEFDLFLAATILFVVAASTDWLDGYYARKYGMVTTLGRILDPFVDKVIVCGAFLYLLPTPASGVLPWMVVVIVGRELLVTALRSFLEHEGADFSANLSGKLKMTFQCVSATVSLGCCYLVQVHGPLSPSWSLTRDLLLYCSVFLTVFSGAIYVRASLILLRSRGA